MGRRAQRVAGDDVPWPIGHGLRWRTTGNAVTDELGGVAGSGLPLGLQLIARPQDDARLFAAAAWVAQALDAEAVTQGRCLD